jgi:uncharacterized NAD(P)/FAD-binding protein YdhS
MYRLLQVGCGPTGTSLIRQLVPRLTGAGPAVSYVVADPRPMGPGLAFATPYDLHLLNVRAGAMSLNPEAPDEFTRWRSEHAAEWAAELPSGWDDYPPRRLFGRYLRSVLAEAVRAAGVAGHRLELVADRVVALRPVGGGRWQARFGSGRTDEYDRVVLALGHLPPAPYGSPGPRYYPDPWGRLDLPPTARVGVVGTRLTAVDAALALRERGHAGPVLLASRSGWLPSVRGPVERRPLRYIPDFVAGHAAAHAGGGVRLAAVAELIGREVQAAEPRPIDWARALSPPPTTADGLRAELAAAESGSAGGWQSVLAAVVPWVSALWRLLDEPDRALLLDRYVSAWAIRVAPFPTISARRLLDMMDGGQLAVRAGLRGLFRAGAGYEFRFAGGDTVELDAVINATGPGFGLVSLRSVPVLRRLLAGGLVTPHRYGGLAVDPRTFEARDTHGVATSGLHLLGDLTRGVWLATNVVGNTVRQSVALADVLADHLRTGTTSREPWPG